jgi:hypothetical protein
MLKWNAKGSLPHQAIATASPKNTVIHVNLASTQKSKIPNPKPAFHVQDSDDIDEILNKLREEMSKLL